MSNIPFSIRIFLPGGEPEGLRIVEKSNWSGVGVVFPRALFAEVRSRGESEHPGVYVLVGPSVDSDLPTIYVGEADSIKVRLAQQEANKDFWTWAVFFASKDGTLNKAHVSYLESRLLELARAAKRSTIANGTGSTQPDLSEADKADAEGFLLDVLSIFPLVGLSAFEMPTAKGRRKQPFRLSSKGVKARAYIANEGFVVLRGSGAVSRFAPSASAPLRRRHEELVDLGVLAPEGDHYVFTQDYVFTSPSLAASVVRGMNTSGPMVWKDPKGKSLKQLQMATEG